MSERWRTDHMVDGYFSGLVVDGDSVYGAMEPGVVALSLETGDVEWTVDLPAHPSTELLVDDGVVHVGTADGSLTAFDAGTGDRLWRFRAERPLVGQPAAIDGQIVCGSTTRSVFGNDPPADAPPALFLLDRADGTANTEITDQDALGTEGFHSAAAVDGAILAGYDFVVAAVDPATGTVEWTHDGYSPGAISAELATTWVNGRVLVPAHREVTAFDGRTREQAWSASVSGQLRAGLDHRDGVVYGGGEMGVFAIDTATGDFLLDGHLPIEAESAESPYSIAPHHRTGVVWMVSGAGSLQAVHVGSGDTLLPEPAAVGRTKELVRAGNRLVTGSPVACYEIKGVA